MNTAELCELSRRTAIVVAQLRRLSKHGDRTPDGGVAIQLLELEQDLSKLVHEVQLRELTKFRRRAVLESPPRSDSATDVPIDRLGLQGARQ